AGGEAYSSSVPLCRRCPRLYRPKTFAWEDSAVEAALRRRKRVDREAPRERGPAFPVSQWPEQYGHSRHAKCNNGAGQCAFRCRLGIVSFLRAEREDGHR